MTGIMQHVLVRMHLSPSLNKALQSNNVLILEIIRGESHINSCMHCDTNALDANAVASTPLLPSAIYIIHRFNNQ